MATVPATTASKLDVGVDSSHLSSTSNGFDSNSVIERTKEVRVDANDYSRFKNIGADSDSEDEKPKNEAKVVPTIDNSKCRNCSNTSAKLKCGVCKKVVYCARKCQASDWQFHKRICKKPEPVKKPEPPRQPSAKSSTSSSKASVPKTTSSQVKKTTTSVMVEDEPDLPQDMRGYKNGLPYFHRELSTEEKKLIGDIAPQKIERKPVTAASTRHDGSAWNTAGTFEERIVTRWAKEKWNEIFTGAIYEEGAMQATLKVPETITGDASICVVRGKKRYLFDFNFKVPFEISISGGDTCKGSYQLNDISNDEDYEVRPCSDMATTFLIFFWCSSQISCTLTKKPKGASEQSAVQAFVSMKQSGLQKELVRLIGVFASEFQRQ
ncbi:hypothetical protein PsorP6_004480 [Peronosclerospora sorghi]|uniref:Uncharacterized protein n=1 Tax=Peronosclerospora sorghi TaxID=230839 RepID=A0ACC0VQE0_9STRA|nr:hypothetical protein PsorP6_004480 [Peronosclerospora sorghi]